MSSLPSGTVTFLYTDIEGSSRLWEQQPEAMRRALERHDVILRQAVENQDGIILGRQGMRSVPLSHQLRRGCRLQWRPSRF